MLSGASLSAVGGCRGAVAAAGDLDLDGYPAPAFVFADTNESQRTRQYTGAAGAIYDSGPLYLRGAYSLSDTERTLLMQIEEAMTRMKEGTYAICTNCGATIGEKCYCESGSSTAWTGPSQASSCSRGRRRRRSAGGPARG